MTENVIEFAKRGAPKTGDETEVMHGDGEDGGQSVVPAIEISVYDDGEVHLVVDLNVPDAAFERAIDAVRGFRQDWRDMAKGAESA